MLTWRMFLQIGLRTNRFVPLPPLYESTLFGLFSATVAGEHMLMVVISHPAEILKEACDRIINFCNRHAI